jgi:hypothetical protein
MIVLTAPPVPPDWAYPFLAISAHFARHWQSEGLGGGALAIAYITQMPVERPSCLRYVMSQSMWTWHRDALQTVIPAGRRHASPDPVIVPSATPSASASPAPSPSQPPATPAQSDKGESSEL